MKDLEISAKTVEEAIQQALEQLGASREEVEVDILSEGKTGILGLGAEEARVRVRLRAPEPEPEGDVTETARRVLEELLGTMGISASVTLHSEFPTEEGAAAPVAFDIRGDDLGILIGRHGQTLSALQYVVRLVVSHQCKVEIPIIIDVEGYKQRRYEALQALARRLAERVKANRTPFTLEPMPAYERRIIHLTLADDPDVSTESTGEGEARKVVISLRKK